MDFEMSSSNQSSSYADGIDVNAAQRHLKLALSVTAIIAMTVVSAALSFGAHPIGVRRDIVVIPMTTTLHAETNASGAVRS